MTEGAVKRYTEVGPCTVHGTMKLCVWAGWDLLHDNNLPVIRRPTCRRLSWEMQFITECVTEDL